MFETERETGGDDFESLTSALVLSESDIDDLCDAFTERCSDVLSRGMGRANGTIGPTQDVREPFA